MYFPGIVLSKKIHYAQEISTNLIRSAKNYYEIVR